jgi:hypothetical protein
LRPCLASKIEPDSARSPWKVCTYHVHAGCTKSIFQGFHPPPKNRSSSKPGRMISGTCGVRIFLNDETRRGVLHEHRADPCCDTGPFNDDRHSSRHVGKAGAPRLHFNRCLVGGHGPAVRAERELYYLDAGTAPTQTPQPTGKPTDCWHRPGAHVAPNPSVLHIFKHTPRDSEQK